MKMSFYGCVGASGGVQVVEWCTTMDSLWGWKKGEGRRGREEREEREEKR
jgi:hypothetical protein